MSAKASMRSGIRRALAGLGPARRALEDELVTAAVQATPEWAAARTVALYKAVPPELSAVGLTNAAWRQSKRTAFPRVEGPGLRLHAVASWSQLRTGAYGIPEPDAGSPAVAPTDVDLWIVPGVAFDLEGGRLGQGGGYYDRLLPERRHGAPVWGVCFDAQVVEAVPRAPHDVRVDRVFAAQTVS